MRPWLFGIAFRVATAQGRLAFRRREVLVDHTEEGFVAPTLPADERLAAQEAHRLLADAMQCVEVDRRAVLVMHDLDELPMSEIAEALAIPVNTAYSRLRLARAELKTALVRASKRRPG